MSGLFAVVFALFSCKTVEVSSLDDMSCNPYHARIDAHVCVYAPKESIPCTHNHRKLVNFHSYFAVQCIVSAYINVPYSGEFLRRNFHDFIQNQRFCSLNLWFCSYVHTLYHLGKNISWSVNTANLAKLWKCKLFHYTIYKSVGRMLKCHEYTGYNHCMLKYKLNT